jgi:hypothetical protein
MPARCFAVTRMNEDEVAALVVPARFLGLLHPHFREVQAVLAIQVADEARHVAFGMMHLQERVAQDPATGRRIRVAAAGRRLCRAPDSNIPWG